MVNKPRPKRPPRLTTDAQEIARLQAIIAHERVYIRRLEARVRALLAALEAG